jgi:lipopolysaccharide assembly protein A
MRWLHVTVIVLLVAITIIFLIQNLGLVTLSFLSFSARVPMALLVGASYLLGMATGGSLVALLRRSFEGSKRRMAGS